VGLCDRPEHVVRRVCRSLAADPSAADERAGSGWGGCDGAAAEALLRVAERLRDHARWHARPARVALQLRPHARREGSSDVSSDISSDISSDVSSDVRSDVSNDVSSDVSSDVSTVHWVEVAVGDDPVAAGWAFAAAHGLSEADVARIAAALEEELLPFDFAKMCPSEAAVNGAI
jgi:hypothetical protein